MQGFAFPIESILFRISPLLRRVIFFCLVLLAGSAQAARIQVQIAPAADSFELVDALVAQGQMEPPPVEYALATLTAHPPQSIRYLIRPRPVNHLLQLMLENPNWVEAQLARRVIVEYPYGQDVTAAMAGLEGDPRVELVLLDGALNPLVLDPAEPVHGEPVVASVTLEDCQWIPVENSQGLTHNVVRNGDRIEVELVYGFYFPVTPILCGPEPEFTDYELGAFFGGEYTLALYRVSHSAEFPVSDDERQLLLERPLVIAGGPIEPVVIPTLDRGGLWLLVLSMLVVLVLRTRMQ